MGTRLPRCRFHDPLSRLGASKQAGQTKMDSAFIDEFQAAEVREPFRWKPFLELAAEALDAQRVPLAIMKRLFFRGKFNCCNSRHIVLGLTTIWADWATWVHNSCRVRSGCALTAARMMAAQSLSARVGPCASGSGVAFPVSRFRCNHFSTVDKLTLNVTAMAAWVC